MVGDVRHVAVRESAIRREGDVVAVHTEVTGRRLENGPEAVVLVNGKTL